MTDDQAKDILSAINSVGKMILQEDKPVALVSSSSISPLHRPLQWLRFAHGLTVNTQRIDSIFCLDADTMRKSLDVYTELNEEDGHHFALIITCELTHILNGKHGVSREVAEHIVTQVSEVLNNYNNDYSGVVCDIEGMIATAKIMGAGLDGKGKSPHGK